MKTIILLGELGRQFGRRHRLDVHSAAEAIRALCANFADFSRFVASSHERNVGYRVLTDRTPTQEVDQLRHPVSHTIHIVPVVAGAGGGVGQILAGAALIAVGVVTGNPYVINVGVAVALGGVAQMLAPAPRAKTPAERPENAPSYIFDGPVNTTAQGHPVPVGYGRMIIGSAVISAGIVAEELPISGPDPAAVLGALGKS